MVQYIKQNLYKILTKQKESIRIILGLKHSETVKPLFESSIFLQFIVFMSWNPLSMLGSTVVMNF